MAELLSLLLHQLLHSYLPPMVANGHGGPVLLLLLASVAQCRHLLSVIELGGLYYYDSSYLIVNKTFEVVRPNRSK